MATPLNKRKVADNEAAIQGILKNLADVMRARTLDECYGELILKVNFTRGEIMQHRVLEEKIVKHGD